jgi:hypothetical protein
MSGRFVALFGTGVPLYQIISGIDLLREPVQLALFILGRSGFVWRILLG